MCPTATPRPALGFTTHQAFDHAAFLSPIVKGSVAVTAESASHWIAHAAQLALKEPRGTCPSRSSRRRGEPGRRALRGERQAHAMLSHHRPIWTPPPP
jgi:hypothetical protein